MLLLKLPSQRGELSLRASNSHARLQPSYDFHRVSRGLCFVQWWPRSKDVDRSAWGKDTGEIEGRGQHTHDSHWMVIQHQLPAHHARVRSKPPPPKAMTQQQGRWSGIPPLAL